jgi:hypothetical protein
MVRQARRYKCAYGFIGAWQWGGATSVVPASGTLALHVAPASRRLFRSRFNSAPAEVRFFSGCHTDSEARVKPMRKLLLQISAAERWSECVAGGLAQGLG